MTCNLNELMLVMGELILVTCNLEDYLVCVESVAIKLWDHFYILFAIKGITSILFAIR